MRNGRSGAEGSRTLDLLNAIQALSQLSYGPTRREEPERSRAYSPAAPMGQLNDGTHTKVNRYGRLGLRGAHAHHPEPHPGRPDRARGEDVRARHGAGQEGSVRLTGLQHPDVDRVHLGQEMEQPEDRRIGVAQRLVTE